MQYVEQSIQSEFKYALAVRKGSKTSVERISNDLTWLIEGMKPLAVKKSATAVILNTQTGAVVAEYTHYDS